MRHPDPRDSAEIVADHLARVTYDHLPEEVVRAAKAAIVDTLACIIAGTDGEEWSRVVSLVSDWGGKPLSTVVGAGLKTTPDYAVLANGSAVRQYDFDDTHDEAVCHPTPASLIPALAIAEATGGVSGKELVAAVALSNDLSCRIALAITGRLTDYPWFRASIVGIFGAAAASAKILRADAERHYNALGLALPQASGSMASLNDPGSSVRAIRDGLCYRGGILAASLAARGVRGDRRAFDGPYGLFHAYFRGEYDRDVLVDDLGVRYETTKVSLKPWPSARHFHGALTAILGVMDEHALTFEDIDHVMLHVGDVNLDRCRPVSTGLVPHSRIDLLCNFRFAAASALRHRGLPLKLFCDGTLADDVVLNAVPKVKWIFNERQNGSWSIEPGLVDLVLTDGRTLSSAVKFALGHPSNPMTKAQRLQKLIDCAGVAARPLDAPAANRIFDMVEDIESLDDVGELIRLVA